MKRRFKVVCIEPQEGALEMNRVYDAINEGSGNYYQIYDNGDQLGGWLKERFVLLRDVSLKELLDNE